MKKLLFFILIGLLISPVLAVPNLFSYSEQSNQTVVWSRNYIYNHLNDTVVDPNGFVTADTYNVSTGVDTHYIGQSITYTAGLPYTFSAYFKKNGVNNIIQLTFSSTRYPTNQHTNANISSCTITASGTNTSQSNSATSYGDWCRISHTAIPNLSGAGNALFMFTGNNPTAARAPSYTGTGNTSESVAIWGMMAEQGNTVSAYNATNAAPTTLISTSMSGMDVTLNDITVSGTPTSWYWVLGDGNTSTSKNLTYTYPATGSFNINLTTTNAYGSNTSGIVSIVAGAGEDLSNRNATHTYTKPGVYTITHTATNAYGTDTATSFVIVIIPTLDQLSPFHKNNPLMVSLEKGTFTSSRDLTEKETERVLLNMYKPR